MATAKRRERVRILNFGSLNLDYFYSVEHFVRSGETLASTDMEVLPGGKGFNQSIALSRSGQEVWHAGAVGESDSKMLIEYLLQNQVHISLVMEKQGSSGHAIIQNTPNGENCILLYGGANQKITREDADKVLNQFEKGDYLILQNEISEVGYIMKKAYEKGMRIVFNPSPLNEQVMMYPLEYVEYFVLNEIEAGQLCTMKVDTEEKGCEEIEGIALAKLITQIYPNAKVILTLGERGAIYMDHSETVLQEAYMVKVIDTTGAGDTFTGFIIGSLVGGKSVKEAMSIAAKAAALSVTKKGAAPSIPKLEDITF